jgi:3,4-dihydroxy-2-butanone 4-phosphate synthase
MTRPITDDERAEAEREAAEQHADRERLDRPGVLRDLATDAGGRVWVRWVRAGMFSDPW